MYEVDKAQQRVMEEVFYRQLHERCRPDGTEERPFPMVVGIETEYMLVDSQWTLIPEGTRNRILEALDHSSPELGSSTIETHTDPVAVAGTDSGNLLYEARRVEYDTIAAAQHRGCRLVRIGCYPGAWSDMSITQSPPRYQHLMDVSHAMHGPDAPQVQVGTITLPPERCTVMAGCQSMHINIQMPAGERVIRALNKAIELVPALVALGAHSPLMNLQPSGYHELRTVLWEPLFTFPHIDVQYGVNTRRVGFPEYYYRGWEDYWRDVGRKLFMTHNLEHAFDSNMKQFWRNVRIKPCPGRVHDCLLEVRTLSTQPTVEEDVAFYLLMCGMLHDEEWLSQPLLPMEYVKVNLDQASRHGLESHLYTRGPGDTIQHQRATTVLSDILAEGMRIWRRTSPEAADLVGLLCKRVHTDGASPALTSLRVFERALEEGHSRAEAAQAVMRMYVV